MLFEQTKTVKEAYQLLHSLLQSFRPVPKPRIKPTLYTCQQSSLLEALRRGIETGDRILTLQHNTEIKRMPEAQQKSFNSTPEPGGSARSAYLPTSQTRITEDVRHSTYRRLDSLEETIRELENTLIEIGGQPTSEQLYSEGTTRSMTGIKKPKVPPKPSTLSPALIQVHCLLHMLRQHALCSLFTSSLWVVVGS